MFAIRSVSSCEQRGEELGEAGKEFVGDIGKAGSRSIDEQVQTKATHNELCSIIGCSITEHVGVKQCIEAEPNQHQPACVGLLVYFFPEKAHAHASPALETKVYARDD
mmetsp:Transcript_18954/g.30479  ORF Transcript_18954/g.30479 Transcript_18954/m.30479 type:complete len:108 (+) Transcript_18954:2376-2699(+)